MIRRIMVPMDGSEWSEQVLPTVADLARTLQAEVIFVQVLGTPLLAVSMAPNAGALISPEFLNEELEAEAKAAESYLSSLSNDWRARGLNARWEVVSEGIPGSPGKSLIDFASSRDVDLIAMSTHGRSGLSRVIFGSVAEQVVRQSKIPVLLYRPQQAAEGRANKDKGVDQAT